MSTNLTEAFGLSSRAIKGNYFLALEETMAASWLPLVVNSYTTDQLHEIYKWLGGVASMKKFRGERVRDSLAEYDLTVIGDKYENTLAFKVDDVKRDKTGAIMRKVGEMGMKAATLGQRLFTTLLEANPTAFDGTSFFANSHTAATLDNLRAPAMAGAAPTAEEFANGVNDALTAMFDALDDSGDPMNEFAREFLVMIPTELRAVAHSALKDTFLAAGVSNPLINQDVTIKLATNPRLTGATTFFTFRTDLPTKVGIWQEEDIGSEAFKTLGVDSDGAFWRDEIAFGCKRIANAALGRFELATKSTFA